MQYNSSLLYIANSYKCYLVISFDSMIFITHFMNIDQFPLLPYILKKYSYSYNSGGANNFWHYSLLFLIVTMFVTTDCVKELTKVRFLL